MGDMSKETNALFVERVADARYLLDALAKGETGKVAAPAIEAADLAVLHEAAEKDKPEGIAAAERAKFDAALQRATKAIAPLTVQSLKDSDGRITEKVWWWRSELYRAKRITIPLIGFALLFVFVAIVGEVWGKQFARPDAGTGNCMRLIWNVIESLTPFTYGALGAAVYLLRWLHIHIYERTFDRRRGPEYVNRVLLGSIAGGAIVMFVDQIVGEQGKVVALSAAALGFLAGYNTDLLFTTLERITAAILPKVGIDSVRRRTDADAAAEAALLKQLTDQLAKAPTAQEKADIMKLIEKIVPKK